MRHPASVVDSDARHYPTIGDEMGRIVWGRFGVRLEAATDALLEEVRVQIPPRLVQKILLCDPPHGDHGYKMGCRCGICQATKRAEHRREYLRRTA